MKQTVRYESLPLNQGKRVKIPTMVEAFVAFEDKAPDWVKCLDNPTAFRDALQPEYPRGRRFAWIKRSSMP